MMRDLIDSPHATVHPAIQPIPQNLILLERRNRRFLEGQSRYVKLPRNYIIAAIILFMMFLSGLAGSALHQKNLNHFRDTASSTRGEVTRYSRESYKCGKYNQNTCYRYYADLRFTLSEGGAPETRRIKVWQETYDSRAEYLTVYYDPKYTGNMLVDGALDLGTNFFTGYTIFTGLFAAMITVAVLIDMRKPIRFSRNGTLYYGEVVSVEKAGANRKSRTSRLYGATHVVNFRLPDLDGSADKPPHTAAIDAKTYKRLRQFKDITQHRIAVLYINPNDLMIL